MNRVLPKDLDSHRKAQAAARAVMSEISSFIRTGMAEYDIATFAAERLRAREIDSFWYYGIPALVLVGKRTLHSVSGRDYRPSEEAIKLNDLVTVDLSPEVNGCWGDLACSFPVVDGKAGCTGLPPDLNDGMVTEIELHEMLTEVARPQMTFHDLHGIVEEVISHKAYRNLDLGGNFGHSIEKQKEDRIYIERGCKRELRAGLFTFEPHLSKADGTWGFKLEEIYYFVGDRLSRL